jgi:hypothetical protein
MRALLSRLGLLGSLALAVLPAPAGAQAVGSEFQINTYTPGNQLTDRGSVAADANGNFVVAWQSAGGQDGDTVGVFGQRYDSEGMAQGAEFRVNSYTTSAQGSPAVASDASGSFVVAWSSSQDGSSQGIFGQRYDSGGVAQGAEFRVNSYTTGYQSGPSVASDASGNFVVVWGGQNQDGSDWGIFGQRYDSAGVAQGAEFRVNSFTLNQQLRPSVASDASGNFVVVWRSFGQDGSGHGIFGQRYDSAGGTLGAEFRVNTYTTGGQYGASVASDATGNFVVAWISDDQDGSGWGIFGQRYDSAGRTLGDEFRVNSYTTGTQFHMSVASEADGGFVVVWESLGQDGSGQGIFGQRYDSAGLPQSAEFQINSFTSSDQTQPSVSVTGGNQFVVAWTSSGQDGSGYGVFGQRFDFSETQTITVVSPNTNVKWRLGSLHPIQWTHTVGADASFRIELDRDDDGDYEELVAAHAPAGAARGSYAWTVTGPPSATARIRVSWSSDLSVSDASDVTFRITPAEAFRAH